MQINHKIFFICAVFILSSCATTRKGKLAEGILAGTAAGVLYGSTINQNKRQNEVFYGSLGGVVGAATVALLDDSDKEISELNAKLKAFSELQQTMEIEGRPLENKKFAREEIIFKGKAIQKSDKIPGHVNSVLKEGDVIGYKADQWIDFGTNKAAHIDEIWEYSNPEFKLNTN
jgi:hypothetical protein